MHVYHLVPNLNFGGLQKVVRLLSLGQKQSGHTVTVGCWNNVSNHPEAQAELEASGVPVVHLRRGNNGGLTFGRVRLLRMLMAELRSKNVDILHVHNPFGYYPYGALAALAVRRPVLNTIHLTAMFDHPRFGKKGRVSFWASAMLSDAIVSVCDDADRYMKRKFRLPKKKFFVVDNGIELDPFLAVPRRVPHEEVVFGFAGRMAPEKNHHVLLDAFSLFSRKHANVRLRILGGGTLDAQIREQARKLQLDPIVEFCGFSHDVPGFLATLDVYVLPSKYEALPLSLLEAIASGLPAVATTVGAVPDIIENTQGGWLCPPDDPQALCAAMEVALASHDRIERGERARRLVSERYSASRMTRDYETVYQKFLRKSLSIPA